MSDRTILKLEIVERAQEYGGPTYEYVATYLDADLHKVAAELIVLGSAMSTWNPGTVVRPDRWPHKVDPPEPPPGKFFYAITKMDYRELMVVLEREKLKPGGPLVSYPAVWAMDPDGIPIYWPTPLEGIVVHEEICGAPAYFEIEATSA